MGGRAGAASGAVRRVSRRLVLRPEAQDEITEAAAWYEVRAPGLAAEFLRALDATVASILRNPFLHPMVHQEKRRALLRRFPYGLIYVVSDDEVIVLGCVHTHRHPDRWQYRR